MTFDIMMLFVIFCGRMVWVLLLGLLLLLAFLLLALLLQLLTLVMLIDPTFQARMRICVEMIVVLVLALVPLISPAFQAMVFLSLLLLVFLTARIMTTPQSRHSSHCVIVIIIAPRHWARRGPTTAAARKNGRR